MKLYRVLLTIALITGFATRATAQAVAGSLAVLTTVSANLTADNKITISWTTRQQINTDCFNVEKSNDGLGWQCIAVVNATGNSTLPVTYTVLDIFPVKGANFYRIRFKTLNGDIGYTAIKNVRVEMAGLVCIYPNPSTSVVNISLAQMPAGDWNVSLVNDVGKLILQKRYSKALNVVSVPVDNYPNGIYTIQIDDGNKRQCKKLMINHN